MQDCVFCGEHVGSDEASDARVNGQEVHYECALRAVVGSVAHVERRCSCYVPGSTCGDPEGLTKREAARAAAALWHKQRSQKGHGNV